MKYHKAVYVTLQDIKGNLNRGDDVYANRVAKNERDNNAAYKQTHKDFSCQYDNNRDDVICTCKRRKNKRSEYFSTSHQTYRSLRYTSARGFTDVGVGSIKPVPRTRVRRIYLPNTEDRGVGSSDLTSYIMVKARNGESYYDHKNTSSKCVGGAMECNDTVSVSEKLSPIYQTKSGSTSPNIPRLEENKNNTKHLILIQKGSIIKEQSVAYNTNTEKTNEVPFSNKSTIKSVPLTIKDEKGCSSDSLVQHVYNLETPSSFQQSKKSLDLMGNTLEREYIKMFATQSKHNSSKPIAEITPIQDSKSTSMRKRFEALRCNLSKGAASKEHCIVTDSRSRNSSPSRRDVSIASDPPSLVARSFIDTKKYSPTELILHNNENGPHTSYRKPVAGEKESSHWSTDVVDGDCQDAKGMFKLWGKKFKLDEDNIEKTFSCNMAVETKKQKKKVEIILPQEEVAVKEIEKDKGERKRFSFFKWKNKDKSKQLYKSKKGVTAGRCEVGDGLTIKIGAANEYSYQEPSKQSEQITDSFNDIVVRKAWLKRFLDNKNDSRNSVNIRWNNDMYATSSSTVFGLIECIYKNTGIVFRSKSEVTSSTAASATTGEFGRCYISERKRVNFMPQNIQAWMMPKMIRDNNIAKSITIINSNKVNQRNIEVKFSNQKWLIDNSKTFSQKIELVLNTKNVIKDNDTVESSKYIVIDIPRGYFSETSCEDEKVGEISDEQVFNITEYETAKSNSSFENKRNDCKMDIGDYNSKDIRVTINVKDLNDKELRDVETMNNTPLAHRDVIVQGSTVCVPKRFDLVSVGIITQHTNNRDLRQIKKSILKMQEEITYDKSTHAPVHQRKCELAESYLQDYCRHWSPLGIDLYSWCISDSKLRGSSENNSLNSFNYQGDCSKSCPNIYDDYQTSSIIVSSCETSSCSRYTVVEETMNKDDETKAYFNRIQKNSEDQQPSADGIRVLPKDSVEVFKRRKIYAASKKDNWCTNGTGSEPSIANKPPPKFCTEWEPVTPNPQKKLKKHVSLKDFEFTKKVGDGILSYKGSVGCNISKKKESCPKLAQVNPKTEEKTAPLSKASCAKRNELPCSNKDSLVANPWAPNMPRRPLSPPQSNQSSLAECPPPDSRSSPQLSPCMECCKKQKKPCTKKVPSPHYVPYLEGSPVSSHSISPSHPSSPCLKTSLPTNYRNKLTPQQKCSPPKLTQPCGCNPEYSCGSPHCLSNISCSSKISKNQTPKSSMHGLKKPASSKLTNAFKHLTKCLSKKNSGNQDVDGSRKRKEGKQESPTALCPSSPCCTPSYTGRQSRTGVHLTKKPVPRKLSNPSQPSCNVIRLNSKENLFIKIKQTTPSTDEIRDARNIKVQDEDGQTLYERHEYKIDQQENRNHIVQGMYRDSRIHRVSTSKTEMVLDKKNLESSESNASLANIVEINFNLKFKQADKTEIHVKKDKPIYTRSEKVLSQTNLKDIYVLQDEKKQSFDQIIDPEKRDVNIKIVINSYQQNANISKRNITNQQLHAEDDFTRKISEKFHTVSTGYSDVLDLQTYSIHKTTVNFSDSTDTSNHLIKPNEESFNDEQTDKSPINSTDVENITKPFEHSASSIGVNYTKKVHSEVFPSDDSQLTGVSTTDNDEALLSDVHQSNLQMPKILNKDEKKMILKQIFENSNDTQNSGNKSKMQSVNKMLRAVLTSDSSECDNAIVNHEIAKELTYQSLKPNYFKDSDSMTNYYQCGSSMSDSRHIKNGINEILFPAEQNNSTDTAESNENQNLRCLCNHLAKSINTRICENNKQKFCCCRGVDKKDKEVQCNLNENILNFNKADYVDVQTQDSCLKVEKVASNRLVTNPKEVQDTKKRLAFNNIPRGILSGSVKAYPIKKLNRQTVLGLTEDDKVIILKEESDLQPQVKNTYRDNIKLKPIDILQLYDMKKAVLEIYAEKTVRDKKEHLVAKLPKFVYNKESEICNYYQEMIRFTSVDCEKYHYDVN